MAAIYADTLRKEALTTRPLQAGKTVSHESGIVHTITPWQRLQRFLILGSDSGTFYAGKEEHTLENVACVRECFDLDPRKTVETIASISESGRAPKNDPAVAALAICSVLGDSASKAAVYRAFPRVLRIPTHYAQFFNIREALSQYAGEGTEKARVSGGTGSGYRRALAALFNSKDPKTLAYHAVKYQQRDGVSQADLLKIAHPKPATPLHDVVYQYILNGNIDEIRLLETSGLAEYPEDKKLPILNFLSAVSDLTTLTDVNEVVDRIRRYNIPREAVPTRFLNESAVWEALLEEMPMTALIRNLGKLSSLELLVTGSETEKRVVAQLSDTQRLRKARVHPIAILAALQVYENGGGYRGHLTWRPTKKVVSALDDAFYAAFGNVEPTGKRIRLALDVSGSMDGNVINGMPFLDARHASAAMALVTHRVERNVNIVAYSDRMIEVPIKDSDRLDQVIRTLSSIPMGGGTYCSLPIQDALNKGLDLDAIVSYTDNETMDGSGYYGYRTYSYGRSSYQEEPASAGPQSVDEWLRHYRQQRGLPTRHAVVAVTSTGFSIGNPTDPGQLSVVGFDTSAPQIISDFIAGKL
jgi:60 kDa SS-A/Ro ribonucleoprotein